MPRKPTAGETALIAEATELYNSLSAFAEKLQSKGFDASSVELARDDVGEQLASLGWGLDTDEEDENDDD